MAAKEQKDQTKKDMNIGTKAIEKIQARIKEGKRFCSFEFYPPKTESGVKKLKNSLSNMVKWNPQWMDVTWGAGGTTSDLTPEICNYIQNDIGGNCMMHLTCTNMPSEKVDIALEQAKKMGFKNILALRGDPPEGQKQWKAVKGGFECALDLVKYIRKNYGDYFGITVSGYPEGHPVVRKKIEDDKWDINKNENPKYYAINKLDDGSYEGVSESDWKKELEYLKKKIDAGGDVIITQLFYDSKLFIEWVKDVRAYGIKAPILPGIMPIRNYGSFSRMTGFCKTVIPKALKERLVELKEDTVKLYEFGLNYLYSMCMECLNATDKDGNKLIPGLHLYTMNTEKCTIELLAKTKIGFEDNKELEEVINKELQRVLTEEKEKKRKKEMEKIELITKNSPVDRGEFKAVNSF